MPIMLLRVLKEGWFISLEETGAEKKLEKEEVDKKTRRYRTNVLFSKRKNSCKFSSFFKICLYFSALPYVGMTVRFTLNIFQGTSMLNDR